VGSAGAAALEATLAALVAAARDDDCNGYEYENRLKLTTAAPRP
jgi:hypothetical protein